MDRSISSNKREVWIDACRGLAILLVLIGHNDPPFIKFIYGFHIPLFFIISGYLFKPGEDQPTFGKMLLKVIKRYIIPYYILCFVNLLAHDILLLIYAPSHRMDKSDICEFVKGIFLVDSARMPDCTPLWFLFSIAIVQVLFYCIRKIKILWARALVLCVLIIGWFMYWYLNVDPDNGLDMPFVLHTVCVGIMFMEAGYLIKNFDLMKLPWITCVIAGVIGIIAIMTNQVNLRIDISYSRYNNVFLMVVGGITMSYTIMYIFKLLQNIEKDFADKVLNVLGYVGKHTIFLMAFDWFSNSLGGQILSRFIRHWGWHVSFLCRAVILTIMFVIWQLILKLIPDGKVKRALDI